jgi:GWxTD domain-containing protein
MNGRICVFAAAFLTAALAAPQAGFTWPGPQEQQSPPAAKQSKKEKQKSDRALMKELETPYKKWLQEEVGLIIMDEERQAFLRLNTNEEREQFIEQFWLRRDPSPDTVENEVKEEHYRRIAYANERFASGIPGWKTDRGRIYIMHGPADEVESHPSGGSYDRPYEEGGGATSTFPFEKWRYRYIEGIGNDVILEFVDPTMSGEYRLTMDPSEKDALLMVPGAGLSECEAMGMCSKVDRFTRSDGTRLPTTLGGQPARMNQFERLDLFAKIQRPPAVKFKDLEEVVNFRLVRNQIQFNYRFDFLRVTSDSTMVPITVVIPNKEMTYKNSEGIHSGVLNIFGRITSVGGRVVQTFEDVVNRDVPEALLQASLKGSSIYQKAVPLRPGLYKLDLVVKDVNSGNVGAVNTALRVSQFEEKKLTSSTLILADLIERVPARQIGLGQFVLGASKVRPRLDATFTTEDRLGIWLQIYNLAIDETTHKASATIEYKISQGEKETFRFSETTSDLQQTGEQVTLEKILPLQSIAPGRYKLEIVVTDNVGKASISPSAEFTVKAAEKPAERAAAARE